LCRRAVRSANRTPSQQIGRGFKEEMDKQSNAWAVHKEYG